MALLLLLFFQVELGVSDHHGSRCLTTNSFGEGTMIERRKQGQSAFFGGAPVSEARRWGDAGK
jgi:hypothetical protein